MHRVAVETDNSIAQGESLPPEQQAPSSAPETPAAVASAETAALQSEIPPSHAAPNELVSDESPEEEEEVDEEEEADDGSFSAAEPLEFIDESLADQDLKFEWYILKVQVNREDSIKDTLLRRIKMNGLERYFKEVVVPTEDVAEFTKTGKRRVVKKKIYPGYILINMSFNDDSWFLVRETSGIGDFTGAGGKPTPMEPKDVERILRSSKMIADEVGAVKSTISFKAADRVRVKEGYFQNFEGDIDAIDHANGRVTVMINIFGRSTPVELEHWQIELV